MLRDTLQEELQSIYAMERGSAERFIVPYSLARHQEELAKPEVIYKSILRNDALIGFVILVLEKDGNSVELRRIVINEPGRGFGSQALRLIDETCALELKRGRIWLDVFEINTRARHVYERCGYQLLGRDELQGQALLLYHKQLSDSEHPDRLPHGTS